MERRTILAIVFLCALLGAAASAQTLNGNATLQGAYSVRYLGVQGYPCDCPLSFSGTFTFDGKGNFQVSGQGTQFNNGDKALTPQSSGTYSVWSNGVVSMTNPFAPASSSSSVYLYGGVGQGTAVIASSTDTAYLDIFVAIPAATAASNATLNGNYAVANLEFASGLFTNTRNAFSTMAANGNGGLGTITTVGSSTNLGGTVTTQTSSGATYTVTANGTGTINFPAPSGASTANQMLAGNKTLYVSSDGSLFIAGSPTGYDFEIGIKQPSSSASTLNGRYFSAMLENCPACGSNPNLAGYSGSFNELGTQNGDEFDHARANYDGYLSFDQTYNQTLMVNSAGYATDSATDYQLGVSSNGNYIISIGGAGDYYLQVGVKTIDVTGTGVFLSPYGIVNGATNAPFTAQLSPGELINLYGSGLITGSSTTASAPFPTNLGGAQVLITPAGATAPINAPIYLASPTQITAVVPYNLPSGTSVVSVQVVNGGAQSNSVNAYVGSTSAGVFTLPPGGLGSGAVLHADYSVVSSSSPAKVGETVQVFLTGLGAVSPAVTAGNPAPTSAPLAQVTNQVLVYIDGQAATVAFAGLAPGLAGVYQLNVTIPSGVSSGTVTLEISAYDSDNLQSTIAIQ